MPLQKGSSRQVISANIKTERDSGRPLRQSIAIALSKARESGHMGLMQKAAKRSGER
jgi:hypothetical protein